MGKRDYRGWDIVHLSESVDPNEVRDDLARRLAAICPCSVREAVRLFKVGRVPLPEQVYDVPPPKTKGRYISSGRKKVRRPACPVMGRMAVLKLIRAAVRTRHFQVVRIEGGKAIKDAMDARKTK